jgi:hypothetical protein
MTGAKFRGSRIARVGWTCVTGQRAWWRPTRHHAAPPTSGGVHRFDGPDGAVAWLPDGIDPGRHYGVFELPDGASPHVPAAIIYLALEAAPKVVASPGTVEHLARWLRTLDPELATALLKLITLDADPDLSTVEEANGDA